MNEVKKQYFIIITISVAIILCFLCFLLGYYSYKEPKLGEFHILGFQEEIEGYYLEIEKSHHAVSYEVLITNRKEEELFRTESTDTNILLKNFTANYGDHLKIHVAAKNKNGTKKQAEEVYEYLWRNASFKNINGRYIDAKKGLSLLLYGYGQNEKYILKLEYLNQVIYEETIKTDNIYVPYQKLEGYGGRITANLYTEKNCLFSIYYFF